MTAVFKDPIFARWLATQYEPAAALARDSDILELTALGEEPATRYVAAFDALTLARNAAGEIVETRGFAFGIRFPRNYLRCASGYEVVTFLGLKGGSGLRIFHPNCNAPMVCLDITPGRPLTDLLYSLFELGTWQRYGVADGGLNPEAASWARRQGRARFPVDARPLKRRRPASAPAAEGGAP